jgi:hypothetical protein
MTKIVATNMEEPRAPLIRWGSVDVTEFDAWTDEDAENIWFDDYELTLITTAASKAAANLNSNGSPRSNHTRYDDENNHSIRGLEAMTAEACEGRLKAKLNIDAAVLGEQRRQRTVGVRDEDAIARASRAKSKRDIHRALELAIKDQESADRILDRLRESSPATTLSSSKNEGWLIGRRSLGQRDSNGRPPVKVGRAMKSLLGLRKG